MLREMLKSKIHQAVVTEANLFYEGSVTIDRLLMDAADLFLHEKVQIANLNTGQRLETYVIEGKAGSGQVCLNGAAARCAVIGDPVHIISYAVMQDSEAKDYKPKVVHVDAENRMTRITEALPQALT